MEENKKPIEPDVVRTRTTGTKTVNNNGVKTRTKKTKAEKKAEFKLKTPLAKATHTFGVLFGVSAGISVALTVVGVIGLMASFAYMLVVALLLLVTVFLILALYPGIFDNSDEHIQNMVNFGTATLHLSIYFWIATAVIAFIWIVLGICNHKQKEKAKEKAKTIVGESTVTTESEVKSTIDGMDIN